ncbi:MAG TPA: glutaredoxin domain-containing protein, partial [Steroidobacteraceae bacterium]|nr:glutaredoxin domain-containing protein [Steroidobacteraceae bacterium]
MAAPLVVVYLKSWCPYCASARALLQSKNVSVREIDVEALPEQREEMIRRSGRRSVPQIFIG